MNNMSKKIITYILIFVMSCTLPLTSYKQSKAIAVVDDMAIVLTVMAAFGLSAYTINYWQSNNAYDEEYWSGLRKELEESYTSARDKFKVLSGGNGNFDDEDGDGDEDEDDLPSFEELAQKMLSNPTFKLTTNSALMLYPFADKLYKQAGSKLKIVGGKIQSYIEKLFNNNDNSNPDYDPLDYVEMKFLPKVDVTTLKNPQPYLLSDVSIYKYKYVPEQLKSDYEKMTDAGYVLLFSYFKKFKSYYYEFTEVFTYYMDPTDITSLNLKYDDYFDGYKVFKDEYNSIRAFHSRITDYTYYAYNSNPNKPFTRIDNNFDGPPQQVFLYGMEYQPSYVTNPAVYINPDLPFDISIEGEVIQYGNESLTQYPIEEIPEPTEKPINVPTQQQIEELQNNLNDTGKSSEELQELIKGFIEQINPNLNPNSNPDTNPDTNPDGKPDTNPDGEPDENPDTDVDLDNVTSSDIGAFLLPESIKDKFPFCVPFDLINAFNTLQSSTRNAPRIIWNMKSEKYNIDYTFDIDMSKYDSVAEILRNMELLLFGVGLIIATRSMIRG